jgi:magnesium transporter
MAASNYLKYLSPDFLFGRNTTKKILQSNPTLSVVRQEATEILITVYDYTADTFETATYSKIEHCFTHQTKGGTTWINIDGLRKKDVEAVCEYYGIHYLLVEDILSIHQRPKMDEMNDILFCLLNMLYFNNEEKSVEIEQISIALGNNIILTFQEDAHRDVFDPLRHKLQQNNSRIRQRNADYLCYSLLDMIVDNYFLVMEKVGEQIQLLEEELIRRNSSTKALVKLNHLRKEMIVLKRNIVPVRDLLNSIIRSETPLIEDRTTKYYKDIHDHILQANDLADNYQDLLINMNNLYLSNVNMKLNEVMKVMAVVTCLLAPATVIGGIFGMNFDKNVNFFHQPWGFYTAVGLMLIIPAMMLLVFKRRGWY